MDVQPEILGTHAYICIYIYLHTHICIYIYTHACVYIYIYTVLIFLIIGSQTIPMCKHEIHRGATIDPKTVAKRLLDHRKHHIVACVSNPQVMVDVGAELPVTTTKIDHRLDRILLDEFPHKLNPE